MMKKTILITGGAGFIGSAVIRLLITQTPHVVINLDKLTYAGNLDSLLSVATSERYFFEKHDICDAQAVRSVLEKYKPDAIMHLAAESHVDRSVENPGAFIQTNVVGTYVLLNEAYRYWSLLDEAKKTDFRFHHISTDEVFGDLKDCAAGALFTEETPYKPSSPYSASKASSDHLVRAWHRTYGLPILLTNCSNNYGPYQFPEKLIPHMILSAVSGKNLPVYGDGQQIRDWLYVEDHAVALCAVLMKGVVGQTYNIGGCNEVRNLQIVEKICALLEEFVPEKKTESIKNYRDLIKFVKDRPGHDVRYAIDASKIERELGWKPRQTFETGLRETVKWYLENQTWWTRILNQEYKIERIGNI